MYRSAGGATRTVCLACILLLAAALPAAAAGQDDAGRYVVHWFNGDGAKVYFDGEYKGTIADTELAVAADPAAPPARKYTVRDGELLMYTGFIERAPAARGDDRPLPATVSGRRARPGCGGERDRLVPDLRAGRGGDLHRQHVRGRRRGRHPPGRGEHHAPASGRVRLQR